MSCGSALNQRQWHRRGCAWHRPPPQHHCETRSGQSVDAVAWRAQLRRLAAIGLLLVRDLLKHYPRDHVDYATRRRIEALVVGETATIVATIRRCNGFVSPRNPNLAIRSYSSRTPRVGSKSHGFWRVSGSVRRLISRGNSGFIPKGRRWPSVV